jgi:hypothetical protein
MVFVLLIISCTPKEYRVSQKDRRIVSESNKIFSIYQDSIKPENILMKKNKIDLFNSHMKERFPLFNRLYMIDYVMEPNYYNIGLYGLSPRINHLDAEEFFFNYVDTVIFVQKYDTLKWNNQIGDFMKVYAENLSKKNKDLLIEQKIGRVSK